VKLYSKDECRTALPAVRMTSAPSPVSALWQRSAHRGAFAPVASTVALAPAAAPSASFAVTGGVAALGGADVPGGVEVQGGTPVLTVTSGLVGTTEHIRIVEQIPAVDPALLDRRGVQVQGTSGLSANDLHHMTALKPNGGVRGAPPRGRPV
jgi:hypothetical protein